MLTDFLFLILESRKFKISIVNNVYQSIIIKEVKTIITQNRVEISI